MNLFDIIKKPVITEKSQRWELTGIYTVIVDKNATKVDIKNAFNGLYGVKVESVNIVKTREKVRNTKTWIAMKKRPSVKAMVKLAWKERISDFIKLKIKD
ncbi:MAG: 50S ribosomal protein L23 [uncultured bacterium (gcode 4)]|uniref:Large ribosomal subunit protein uL23 n=1 Tax=uncultured bacterium (gcode 4) TaxID=1234023 RepID=K2F4C3_9BACT|nr:MAG: 50S ribosomal protein L23 [uncultured bacterium (gcode 4)]